MKSKAQNEKKPLIAVILQRLVMWLDRRRKISFLKRNGWVRCGGKWKYESILSPRKLRTLDEAVEYEKFMWLAT